MADKRDFDAAAATWDEEPRRVVLAREVAAAIAREVPLNPGMDVMDYGCGTGLLTLLLASRVKRITGVDSSAGMLARLDAKCRNQGIDNVRGLLADIEKGEELTERFHLIISSMTMHHVADVADVVRRFREMLHPGGILAVADLDAEDGSFHDDPTGVLHHGFGREEMGRLFTAAGLGRVRTVTATEVVKGGEGLERRYPVLLTVGERNA